MLIFKAIAAATCVLASLSVYAGQSNSACEQKALKMAQDTFVPENQWCRSPRFDIPGSNEVTVPAGYVAVGSYFGMTQICGPGEIEYFQIVSGSRSGDCEVRPYKR